jgi:hypothetical protein
MPPAELEVLRVFSEGEIPVADVRAFLDSIESTYNGLVAFRNLALEWERIYRSWRRSFRQEPEPYEPYLHPWIDAREPFVSRRERLVLVRVKLESPGFWDFAGTSAVLGMILAYIQYFDGRQDRKRKAQLEEVALRLDVVRRAYDLLRAMGLPEGEADFLLDRWVLKPLDSIWRQHAKGLIQGAEMRGEERDRHEDTY